MVMIYRYTSLLHTCLVSDLDLTIKTVDVSKLCVGNPDDIFKALMVKKTFFSKDGMNCIILSLFMVMLTFSLGISVVAEVEKSLLGYPTIRSSGCEILICNGPAKRCLQCTMHRKSLHAMVSQNRAKSSSESHAFQSYQLSVFVCTRSP